MKRTTIIVAALILVLGIVLVWGLSRYKLVLIQRIVENAVIQKAPRSYPEARIRNVFAGHFDKARSTDRENRYLDRLLKASQRLEKIQRLESNQVDRLLEELDPESKVTR